MNSKFLRSILLLIFVSILWPNINLSAQEDHTFYSKAFKSERWYRIYLPASYDKNPDKHYPVVFYFHGWSGRYKWDAYTVDFDKDYRTKERKEPPFVMEWRDYTQAHDVIIVAWDGYEPLYESGAFEREGTKYGHCTPYDFLRSHEKNGKYRGWDFREYFKELIAHVDSTYRTIPDRAHRGTTGLSMGGFMSLYIGGQSKDLISSVSSFCPADIFALFGPEKMQASLPVLEMWRSLKGVPVRLTATDGDWLYYNDMEMKRLWENADLSHFEFHMAHFPDHWAGDTEQQLDYHMNCFAKNQAIPKSWNYLAPGFLNFDLFGYKVNIERKEIGLTLFDHIKPGFIKIISKKFISDGPIIKDEVQQIETNITYASSYKIKAYNLSSGVFSAPAIKKSADGKLSFKLSGGGSIVGINGGAIGDRALVRLAEQYNRDYYYFEINKENSFNFTVVNVGNKDAKNIEITAMSDHPYLTFLSKTKKVEKIKAGEAVNIEDQFKFVISKYDIESSVGNVQFEIKIDGVAADTQKVVFFSADKSPYAKQEDVIVLDGREVKNVTVYKQGPNVIAKETISGGKGNGNGILEAGEEALVYIRLKEGMTAKDTSSYHKTYLVNPYKDKYLSVEKLRYNEKIRQAGATAYSSVLSISDKVPSGHIFDLRFRIESLNDEETPRANRPIYARDYSYRRVKLKVGK